MGLERLLTRAEKVLETHKELGKRKQEIALETALITRAARHTWGSTMG